MGGDGDPVEDEALLDRQARDDYECSVVRPAEALGLETWLGGFLGNLGGNAVLAWAEQDWGESQVAFSTLSAAGELGEPRILAMSSNGALYAPAGLERDRRLELVWQSENRGPLVFAALDEAGTPLIGPSPIEGTDRAFSSPMLVPGHEGSAMFWTERLGFDSPASLKLGVLDDEGKFVRPPVTISPASSVSANGFFAVEGGYLATYLSAVQDQASFTLYTHLLRLDVEGTVVNQITLGRTAFGTFSLGRDAFLNRGDHALIAWTEGGGDYDPAVQEGYTVLRLSRVELDGQRRGDDVRLKAPVFDRAVGDAQFVEIGDDIGLLWSEGGIIYVCAGCMPDNHLNFVILDGSDLTPKSNVVKLHNPKPQGGLIAPQARVIGDDILVVASIQYHVSGEGASGTLRCTPRR